MIRDCVLIKSIKPTAMTTSETTQKIQWINIANLVAYLANAFVTYGVGVSGKFPTNSELSAKYQTLVTPSGYAFSIWSIIFTAELVWAIFQLFPSYRANELVDGVSYYFILACVAQMLWSIVFTTEQIAFSLIAMVSILIPLLIIITKSTKIGHQTLGEYWLMKFPFQIHAGWIMAATLVNFNVVLVAWNVPSNLQVFSGWLSLIALTCSAVYFILKRQWVVPSVLSWASLAIYAELRNPRESIVTGFSKTSIAMLKDGSLVCAVLILLGILGQLLYDRYGPARVEPDPEQVEYVAAEENMDLVSNTLTT
jgi:benzodiazapine receptor